MKIKRDGRLCASHISFLLILSAISASTRPVGLHKSEADTTKKFLWANKMDEIWKAQYGSIEYISVLHKTWRVNFDFKHTRYHELPYYPTNIIYMWKLLCLDFYF